MDLHGRRVPLLAAGAVVLALVVVALLLLRDPGPEDTGTRAVDASAGATPTGAGTEAGTAPGDADPDGEHDGEHGDEHGDEHDAGEESHHGHDHDSDPQVYVDPADVVGFCSAFQELVGAHTARVADPTPAAEEAVAAAAETLLAEGESVDMSGTVRHGFEAFVADVTGQPQDATPDEQAEFSAFLTSACPPSA